MNVWFAVKRSDGGERVWFTTDKSVYTMSSESLRDDARWRFGEGFPQYNRDVYVFAGNEVSGHDLVKARPNVWNDLDIGFSEKSPEPERAGVTLEELFAEDDEG